MFGSSKPVVLERYGRRRSGWRLPSWLVLLLFGIALGVVGVIVVQERYLPPRLSADAAAQLRSEFEQADAERQRLKAELGQTSLKLQAALAGSKTLSDELAASRSTVERQRDEVAALVDALPADPRGGTVAVRAASFSAKGGALDYEVVLTRERAAKPVAVVMQFAVAGEPARGGETTLAWKPVEVSLGGHEIAQGKLPLPEGFKPRQVTIQVLDRVGGKALGMRVILVR